MIFQDTQHSEREMELKRLSNRVLFSNRDGTTLPGDSTF